MKLLKKVLVFALIAVMVLTAAACGEKDEDGNKGNAGATATPKPTPKLLVCDLTPAQLNSYYVEYTVNEVINGEPVTRNIVEAGYSTVVLRSEDGGESFQYATNGAICFTVTDTNNEASFFSSHMRYEANQLEDKGTETVAGKECTHYYFKNGLFKFHMYVDKAFGSTGMTLKYVDEKVDGNGNPITKTIEVTKLEFETIDSAKFLELSAKVVTPAPETPAPAEPAA